MDELDGKLNKHFDGRVVRKDLLHRIKKGINVPTFVLEFLLARYCASDEPEEIKAGTEAVLSTLQDNYVRPDESNQAQSTVQQKGSHRFIDKVHVRYVEKEKRHWAEMENFGSRRIAVAEKFYRDNDRILAGGIWAEVIVGHNDIDDDDYAFFIDDLKPIQLSRFDFEEYTRGRQAFTRDEWLALLIRSIGLEPSRMPRRLQFHFLSRLFPFVEANYNFIELGPRGTGKSYSYSEFSPYSTLISGGQATTPILFYNNAKGKVGLVGFWDIVAFDEVGSIKIKDQDSIQIMKDYMANGRFSRGRDVIANASFAFVGNIDYAINQLVNSAQFDLFYPLPSNFDLAVIDRFHTYLPGWEMPKNTSELLTEHFGFITDYLAAAFHELFAHHNRYEWVNRHIKLGPSIEGRDEVAIKKTIAAFLKMLHPIGDPTQEELEEYISHAIEGRRRIKEQLNKRKTDDEYAAINLSYFNPAGEEKIVYCPESKSSPATQKPQRRVIDEESLASGTGDRKRMRLKVKTVEVKDTATQPGQQAELSPAEEPMTPALPEREQSEMHKRIFHGDVGYSYDTLMGDYLQGAEKIEIEDPYIRSQYQLANFVRFCETALRRGTIKTIHLRTGFDDPKQREEAKDRFEDLAQSLRDRGVTLKVDFVENIHARDMRLDNGWRIIIDRGLDYFQAPDSWFSVGANDMDLRPCRETMVDIFPWKG